MFTEKIENILKLVEYLHSNIDNFSQYDANFEEIQKLDEVRKQLNPDNSFKEQKEKKNIEVKRKEQFQIVIKNIIEPIIKKLTELNIFYGYEFDRFEKEAQQNIDENDLQRLNEYKNKFLEYRTMKYSTVYSQSFLIVLDELDQIFPEIIRYFIGDENNELNQFKTDKIEVNDIYTLSELIKQGKTKFILPMDINTQPQPTVECSEPHQNTKKQNIESLSQLITHEKSQEIVDFIKVQFKTIKGKGLSILFEVLKELNLILKNQNKMIFHNLCEKEFNWDIGGYEAMRKFEYFKHIKTETGNNRTGEIPEVDEFNKIKQLLEDIIK